MEVPRGARACPECGSDEQTGWSEQARYDDLNLPDEAFDHDDFVRREFGGAGGRWGTRTWVWWVAVGMLLLALLVFVG